uniref:Uncharacterized protein n=1 Tax=Anguilla anguilla TaxID=7936 RepID=A0A0E9SFJ9_ANGAN
MDSFPRNQADEDHMSRQHVSDPQGDVCT